MSFIRWWYKWWRNIHDNHQGLVGTFLWPGSKQRLMIDRSFHSLKRNRRQSILNLKPHSRNTAFRYCFVPAWEICQLRIQKLFYKIIFQNYLYFENYFRLVRISWSQCYDARLNWESEDLSQNWAENPVLTPRPDLLVNSQEAPRGRPRPGSTSSRTDASVWCLQNSREKRNKMNPSKMMFRASMMKKRRWRRGSDLSHQDQDQQSQSRRVQLTSPSRMNSSARVQSSRTRKVLTWQTWRPSSPQLQQQFAMLGPFRCVSFPEIIFFQIFLYRAIRNNSLSNIFVSRHQK